MQVAHKRPGADKKKKGSPIQVRAWFCSLKAYAERDLENRGQVPDLSDEDILAWADAYRQRTGTWPNYRSGEIPEAPDETWMAVEAALSLGLRGCERGSTLARFLVQHRDKRHLRKLPLLTVEQILSWADHHFHSTGTWPHIKSGLIPDTKEESWMTVDSALKRGVRGLPAGSSLAELLVNRRGVRKTYYLPDFTPAHVLAWADAFHERTGRWPGCRSGRIPEAPAETWQAVEAALSLGGRGFPGGSSVVQFLVRERGIRNTKHPPNLTLAQILTWVDAFHARTGRWPKYNTGAIAEAPGETWSSIDHALMRGGRGLPEGGSSLAKLLAQQRGFRGRNR